VPARFEIELDALRPPRAGRSWEDALVDGLAFTIISFCVLPGAAFGKKPAAPSS
jgi:hypothetical protein